MAEQALSAPGRADAFLDELDAVAERAAAAAGGWEEQDLVLAGLRVRLRFAGPALAPMARAFAHVREASPGTPDLLLRLWDSESTGTVLPPPPWGLEDYRPQGKIRGYFGGGLYSLLQPGSESLSILDADRARGWFWVRSPSRLTNFERAAPLRALLHLWLAGRGVAIVHGAAVGTDEGCVLLVGGTGVGKSTSALGALRSSLRILADDSCLVAGSEPPVLHTLYSSAKATEETLDRFPFLEPMVSNPGRSEWDKALIFLHEHVPDRLLASAPLRAIVVPRIAARAETVVHAASASTAMVALAPSTMLQLPGTGAASLRRLGAIVRAVPCHRMDAGTDPAGVTAALADLLDRS